MNMLSSIVMKRSWIIAACLLACLFSTAFGQDPFGDVEQTIGKPVWGVLIVIFILVLAAEVIGLIIGIMKHQWILILTFALALALTGGAAVYLKHVYSTLQSGPF